MPPDPISILKTQKGQEFIRLFFQTVSKGYGLNHKTRQELTALLGLPTKQQMESLHQRLDQLEGRARRMGYLTDEDE